MMRLIGATLLTFLTIAGNAYAATPSQVAGNLKDDTPLRTSGIIDSLGTIEMVTFVEDTFGIELEAHETGVEHFDRIEDLAALVAGKMTAG